MPGIRLNIESTDDFPSPRVTQSTADFELSLEDPGNGDVEVLFKENAQIIDKGPDGLEYKRIVSKDEIARAIAAAQDYILQMEWPPQTIQDASEET